MRFSIDIALPPESAPSDRDTGNTLQRFGQILVGKFADVLGQNGIGLGGQLDSSARDRRHLSYSDSAGVSRDERQNRDRGAADEPVQAVRMTSRMHSPSIANSEWIYRRHEQPALLHFERRAVVMTPVSLR
jgi:hypothetical protein